MISRGVVFTVAFLAALVGIASLVILSLSYTCARDVELELKHGQIVSFTPTHTSWIINRSFFAVSQVSSNSTVQDMTVYVHFYSEQPEKKALPKGTCTIDHGNSKCAFNPNDASNTYVLLENTSEMDVTVLYKDEYQITATTSLACLIMSIFVSGGFFVLLFKTRRAGGKVWGERETLLKLVPSPVL